VMMHLSEIALLHQSVCASWGIVHSGVVNRGCVSGGRPVNTTWFGLR